MSGVTLTAEQAKLLIPILQQIAGSESSGRRTETPTQHGTPGSSSASSSGGGQFGACHRLSPYVFTNDSAFSTSASETEGGCRYDVEELFHKKKKNTKSTEAQSYVLVSLHIIACMYCIIVNVNPAIGVIQWSSFGTQFLWPDYRGVVFSGVACVWLRVVPLYVLSTLYN